MPRGKAAPKPDHTTLEMALVGYEIERARIAGKIRDLQSQLGGTSSGGGKAAKSAAKSEAAPGKRVLSAAARKRIAAAQKKRWAEHRKNVAAGKA
jgi:hypothetical protein